MGRDYYSATYSHNSHDKPEFVRFEIIEPINDAVTGNVVNARMLKWGGTSDGFIDAGHTVYMVSLDTQDGFAELPPVGTKVWGIWSRDVGMWQVVSSPGIAEGPKRLARFTLGEALTTGDASAAATITDQFGPGTDHTETAVTVINLETHTPGTYVFYGDTGDAGQAYWDSGTEWIIIQMECP